MVVDILMQFYAVLYRVLIYFKSNEMEKQTLTSQLKK
jgi:hypothetical protein